MQPDLCIQTPSGDVHLVYAVSPSKFPIDPSRDAAKVGLGLVGGAA